MRIVGKMWIVISLFLLVFAGVPAGHASTDTADADSSQDSTSTVADTTDAVPQRDAIDVLKQLFGKPVELKKVETRKGLEWALLPTFSYNPVYGAAFGALISGSGQRGGVDSHYSTLAVSANYSTTGQIQVQVRGDVFSPGETYLSKADFRYLDTQRSTWGLGAIDDQVGEYPMSFVLSRFYMTGMRRISGPVYLGIGFHYDQFGGIVDDRAEAGESTPYTDYSGGLLSKTTAVGLSINLLADTRDNLVNAKNGYYLNWSYRDYPKALGSDKNWQEFWVECRVYPQLPKNSGNVLGFWLYSWLTFGSPPYLNLPSNGWDTYGRGGRGYLAGRIRGENQIYIESEYRFSLTRDGLWGAVVFLNGVSTASPTTGIFSRVDHGGGIGLRIKFNKHTSTNLGLDYGWGRGDSDGLFLGMSEVF